MNDGSKNPIDTLHLSAEWLRLGKLREYLPFRTSPLLEIIETFPSPCRIDPTVLSVLKKRAEDGEQIHFSVESVDKFLYDYSLSRLLSLETRSPEQSLTNPWGLEIPADYLEVFILSKTKTLSKRVFPEEEKHLPLKQTPLVRLEWNPIVPDEIKMPTFLAYKDHLMEPDESKSDISKESDEKSILPNDFSENTLNLDLSMDPFKNSEQRKRIKQINSRIFCERYTLPNYNILVERYDPLNYNKYLECIQISNR